MDFIKENIVPNFNYWIYIVLMMIGLYAMIVKNNLIKKLIGMSIFQTAIILFYVSIGVKAGAGIPILQHHPPSLRSGAAGGAGGVEHRAKGENEDEDEHGKAVHAAIRPNDYANPLPHVLMLTAIVVGVATLGVGLAVAQRVYRDYGSLEEDEILAKIKASDD